MSYRFSVTINGIDLIFSTEPGVFSPKSIDNGTLSMLSLVSFQEGDKVLDLGCGYGVVGILAAKQIGPNNVVMTDKDGLAVETAKKNASLNDVNEVTIYKSDGFKDIKEKDFTIILSNPPYHTDFSVAKEFIEKGFNRLCTGGKMFMVTKRELWYKNKFTSIFGGVKVWHIDDYFIFMSIKKENNYANKAGKTVRK